MDTGIDVAEETGTTGEGAKAFGGIMAVFAIVSITIGSIIAVTRPMNQRIDDLRDDVKALKAEEKADNERERDDANLHGQITERLRTLEREVFKGTQDDP